MLESFFGVYPKSIRSISLALQKAPIQLKPMPSGSSHIWCFLAGASQHVFPRQRRSFTNLLQTQGALSYLYYFRMYNGFGTKQKALVLKYAKITNNMTSHSCPMDLTLAAPKYGSCAMLSSVRSPYFRCQAMAFTINTLQAWEIPRDGSTNSNDHFDIRWWSLRINFWPKNKEKLSECCLSCKLTWTCVVAS